MSLDIDACLALAVRLADVAGAIAMRHFRTAVAVDDKPDTSPVTIADRQAEQAMRALIAKDFPEHGLIGEEFGADRGDAEFVWVLDPIDGTKSFITGRPLFGSLIALCRAGRPILGVIDCPAARERWVGAEGRPTTHQGRAVRTSACPRLAQAALLCTSPFMFEGADREGFDRLRRSVRFALWGGDCYGYGLLASGYADLVVEAELKTHDWAAIVPVVKGAGGVMTDWQGRELDFAADGRMLVAGDPRAHAQALALLRG
ncbi:MAG: histidinol-phosphatase [Proteobacteria bacterium]|nr:histidinol-phosphatase [Pseudomonadota bacterium]